MKKETKKLIVKIFIILCLCIIIFCLFKIITWKRDLTENDKIVEIISESVKVIEPKETKDKEKYDIDFETLKGINNDTVAYLKVNGTEIDYVVVKTSDNSFYLNHNFEKKKNSAGWLFADYHNTFDGNDKNIVIYGHNMKNGSLFGTLYRTLNKEWYQDEDNRQIVLVTENKTYYYEVFSVYRIDSEDYYINTKFNNNEEFSKFVTKIKSRSVYKMDINIDGKSILTLSTCADSVGKRRVVLHAVLVDSL